MQRTEARRLLEERRRALEEVKRAASKDGEFALSQSESIGELSVYDQEPADVGTETFEREKSFSILTGAEDAMRDVEDALHRLDAGTYGTCEACGRPIGDERLAARPEARYCIQDQPRARGA